jgi:hypothetical protein
VEEDVDCGHESEREEVKMKMKMLFTMVFWIFDGADRMVLIERPRGSTAN